MTHHQMHQILESICTRGCQYVNGLLTDQKLRQQCEEFNILKPHQQTIIIRELKAIMSVYQQTGSCQI